MPPLTLEDIFPLSTIFCLPLYVDFLINMLSIAVAVLINQIFFFKMKSEKWYILHHYNNLNGLPIEIKLSIMKHHKKENLKILDELLCFIPHRDIVKIIYSYLEIHLHSLGNKSISLSSQSSIDVDIKEYGTTSTQKEMENLKQMEDVVNSTKHDENPIWRDKEYLQRYLATYINKLILYSTIYSIMIISCELITFIIIIIEFSKWKQISNQRGHFDNEWNYYNGWCICTSLIQPFLRYYKFLFFYTMDFGSYHPHNINWDNIMKIAHNKYNMKSIIKKLNIFQIVLSLIFGIMWIPLLPGAILLMLAIFCFITALGVPFYILYAIFQYFHECYCHKIKFCGWVIKALQQITLHLMILIILSSMHFCLYSSILSTSVSLYGAFDVVGCLDYEWDWTVHEWHWTNIFVVLSWIFV